jgi:hypothetical protein
MGENPIITGLGWDFGIFWNVGRAVLAGQDPYVVFGSFYPPAATILFAIFAFLPFGVAYGLWTIANVAFLARIVGLRKAPVWLFYFPALFVIAAGQVDLALVALATFLPRKDWKSVAAAILITLKPQVAFLLLPFWLVTWLLHDRKRLAAFGLGALLLQGWPALFDPAIFARWLDKAAEYGGGAGRAMASPGVWSLPIPDLALAVVSAALVGFAIYASLRRDEAVSRASLVLATPTGHSYDGSVLIGAAPAALMVPLSWATLALAHAVGSFWPLSLTTLAVFVWNATRQTASVRSAVPVAVSG